MKRCRAKKVNKRQRKKNSKKPGLFIGRPSSIGIMFWPGIIEREQAKLDSGIVRHSKRKEKLIKKIRKLQYLIWEHKAFRRAMPEVNRRLAHLSYEERLRRGPAVHKTVQNEMWQEYRREHLCK